MQDATINTKTWIKQHLRKWIIPLLLLSTVLIIQQFPDFVEDYYSVGIYPKISHFLRAITTRFRFSVGDIFYAIVCLVFFLKIIRFCRKLKKQQWKIQLLKASLKLARKIVILYIIFHVLWAFNYYRLGIADQLQLSDEAYNKQDVEELVCDLIDKVNSCRRQIETDILPQRSANSILQQAQKLYDTVAQQYSFLRYQYPSLKKSIYTNISHYVGFTGYYNPFIGEAQVSTDVPIITMPYTACHEIAHQLGYASEEQANFVGYLSCSSSKDIYFQYSVYLDLYRYAATELFLMDNKAKHGWELDALVRKDLMDIRRFYQKKENNISPVMNQVYNQYLKANQQTKGIDSYNEVVGLLIAYKKKHHHI